MFCKDLESKLATVKQDGCVYYYCSKHPHRRANSIVLILAFLIFVLEYTIYQAYLPFYELNPPCITFRDAAFCINTFPVTILDCAMAFYKVQINKHFQFNSFSLTNYQMLNKLQHGDVTWIIPNKLIAFSGPIAK